MRNVSWTSIVENDDEFFTEEIKIKRIGHDKVHNVLYIEYDEEKVHAYRSTPVVMYENLLKAYSYKDFIEQYLNKNHFFTEVEL